MRRLAFILPMFLLAFSVRAQQNRLPVSSQPHFMTWKPSADDSVLTLPHAWILANSLELRQGVTALYPGVHYQYNAVRGCIISLNPGDVTHDWTIAYRYWPFALKRHFAIHYQTAMDSSEERSSISGGQASGSGSAGRRTSLASFDDNLEKSGSIFRGVSVGSEGMRLQSGLRLQVSGEIAKGVEIAAALTDQSTPIQPEGNTQALQEVDKVFVQIKSRPAEATLGDLTFDASDYGLGAYTRKLQGVSATARWRNGEATLLAAASKGQFKSQSIQGIEGVQGPYQLTGPSGQREIIVLAGTEKVYLDGILMTRGEDHDYVIDYASGQVTFTQKRLITGDSRLVIDFEYSDQQFQKVVTGAVAKAALWDGRMELRTSIIREADDKDQPLDFIMSDSLRAILKEAGDDALKATVDGAQYVGEGQGSYRKEGDIFVYAGAGQGDYLLRFSYVGEGQGDYAFQGYGIYRYMGPGLGDYLPLLNIPMAESRELATVEMRMNIAKGFSASLEAGHSATDMNLYSSLDDGDNGGQAYKGSLSLEPTRLKVGQKDLGRVDFNASWRKVDERFRFAGRASAVEHGRKWHLQEGRDWGEESRELGARYAFSEHSLIAWEGGHLARIEGEEADRQTLQGILQLPKWPLLEIKNEAIEHRDSMATGQWHYRTARLQARPSIFQLDGGFAEEMDKVSHPDSLWTGRRYREYSGGAGLHRGGAQLSWHQASRRYTRFAFDDEYNHSRAITNTIAFQWRRGSVLDWRLSYVNRNRNYNDKSYGDQRSDLAESRWTWKPLKRALEFKGNYRFASNRASEMVRDTIEVGTGLGNYRYDEILDELVPDADGDILIRQIQTGQFIPVNHLEMSGDLRYTGARLFKDGWKKKISVRSMWRIERRDRVREFWRVNRRAFSPRWGQDSTAVSAQFMHQHDFEYRPGGSGIEWRLRYRNNDLESHQLLNEGQLRRRSLVELRVKAQPWSSWSVEMLSALTSDSRDYDSPAKSDKDISGQQLTLNVARRVAKKLELGVDCDYRKASDAAPAEKTEATAIYLKPRFKWTIGRKGHMRGELEWARLSTASKVAALPYEMFNGDQPGDTQRWSLYFSYRISGYVQTTLSYRGRNEPWRTQVYHAGQVEVRAFF